MKILHRITTKFDDSASYITGSQKEVKEDVRLMARNSGRSQDEFIIEKA